ncbi:hypothetical protein BaRGS_00007420 [Batillaria attramentaria]|uniref:Uncharacterized protein n=1 Tax=Batillaria attramentaria TaxID=370345 RepID=A0ABD0LPC3_9CAEN
MLPGFLDLQRRNKLKFSHMDIPGPRPKRSHRELDDCDECLPISKRINRLHIEAQRKSQGEERQMNGHPVNNNSQPSTSWQSALPHHTEPAGAHGSGNLALGHGFSPPYYPADPSSLSSSCNTCGILPQGARCPHMSLMSPGAQQTLPQHNPANIPTQHQCSQYGSAAMAMPHGFPQNSAAGMVSQHQFQQFGAQESSVDPYPQYSAAVSGQVMDEDYDPELDESENPYYFHINEVLFNAHCERLRRTSSSAPESSC